MFFSVQYVSMFFSITFLFLPLSSFLPRSLSVSQSGATSMGQPINNMRATDTMTTPDTRNAWRITCRLQCHLPSPTTIPFSLSRIAVILILCWSRCVASRRFGAAIIDHRQTGQQGDPPWLLLKLFQLWRLCNLCNSSHPTYLLHHHLQSASPPISLAQSQPDQPQLHFQSLL